MEKSLAPRGSDAQLEVRRAALADIDDRFAVAASVKKLQHLMDEVTKKEITADTVNAACNCVSNINTTIKTVMAAAQFLSGR